MVYASKVIGGPKGGSSRLPGHKQSGQWLFIKDKKRKHTFCCHTHWCCCSGTVSKYSVEYFHREVYLCGVYRVFRQDPVSRLVVGRMEWQSWIFFSDNQPEKSGCVFVSQWPFFQPENLCTFFTESTYLLLYYSAVKLLLQRKPVAERALILVLQP